MLSRPRLAVGYDLSVLVQPWIGGCGAAGALLPPNDYLDAAFLNDQARNSVGKSHNSYSFEGQQWALAVDAASQVAAYRPDLLAKV